MTEKNIIHEYDIAVRCKKLMTVEHKLNIVVPPLPASDDAGTEVCKIKYYIRVSHLKKSHGSEVQPVFTFIFILQIRAIVSSYYISPTLDLPIIIVYDLVRRMNSNGNLNLGNQHYTFY